jgi:ribosomal biogenesis protein LAS1
MALDYLHHYAFVPLLASASTSTSAAQELGNGYYSRGGRSTAAEGAVKRWKKVMKLRNRDKEVGEENASGRELKKLRRDFEDVDMEDVVEALCTTQGIVPLARK